MRRLFGLLILLAAPSWAATYYVKNGGSDGAAGTSDGTAWATLSKVNGATLNPGDSVLFKAGSVWRETLSPPSSGTAGNPITFGNYSTGTKPTISGADLVTGWTLDSGNIWKATLTSTPYQNLWINGTFGDNKASKAACVNEYDWYWASNVLYVYAASDPDTLYTNPGIEYIVRDPAIELSQSYIVFDGLTAEKAQYASMRGITPGSHGEIKNCLAQWSAFGIKLGDSVGGAYTDWLIHDNETCYVQVDTISITYLGTFVKVYRNNCHDADTTMRDTGQAWTTGIKFYDGSTTMKGCECYENYVHDCGRPNDPNDYQGSGVGIWSDGVQNPTNPALIHHNLVVNCEGNGIFHELTSNTHTWGNVIVNCGTSTGAGDSFCPSGIALDSRATSDSPRVNTDNNLIYNNTIYGGRCGIKLVTYDQDGSTHINNNLIKNNIAVGFTEHALIAQDGGDNTGYGTGNVYDYNCFGAQATNFIQWSWAQKSTYSAWESAYGGTTHSINANPLLTNPSGGVFTLQVGSPCVDVGANLGSTYQNGLLAATTWPSGVVTGSQGGYGTGWEIGAYIYQSAGSPYVLIIGALLLMIPAVVVGRYRK